MPPPRPSPASRERVPHGQAAAVPSTAESGGGLGRGHGAALPKPFPSAHRSVYSLPLP
ncbi:hypothetical protein [Azospirillum largimobile]